MKVLITAGPTREAIDPIRFISNRSTGKMGYALACAAVEKGHQVTLVSGPVALTPPEGLARFVPVVSAAEMAEAVKRAFPECDLAIMCAAVADYRPKTVSLQKMKKKDGDLVLELERTEDILKTLGSLKKTGQILTGFAAETENLEQSALDKLKRKNLDWIAANQVKDGQAFGSDRNALILLSVKGEKVVIPLMSKIEAARKIVEVFVS